MGKGHGDWTTTDCMTLWRRPAKTACDEAGGGVASSLRVRKHQSETLWSDFAFNAGDEPQINPLDGSAYGERNVDDCWAMRGGVEYLLALASMTIPLRTGLSWEQRPAVGTPDEFWGFSLGSGWALGGGAGRRQVILDIAYRYAFGRDVLGSLVPDQPGLTTDVDEHEVYLSGIWHF